MKKTAVMLLFLLFATPCFGANPPDYPIVSEGGYVVGLKEYIERRLDDQIKYFESRLHDIDRFNAARFSASEQALTVGKTELDRRFVLVTEYSKETTVFRSELSELKAQVDSMGGVIAGVGAYESNMIGVKNSIVELKKDVDFINKQLDKETGSKTLWIAWVANFIFILIIAILNFLSRKATSGKE